VETDIFTDRGDNQDKTNKKRGDTINRGSTTKRQGESKRREQEELRRAGEHGALGTKSERLASAWEAKDTMEK